MPYTKYNLIEHKLFTLSSLKENSKVYPTEVYLPAAKSSLPKDSVAMIHQLRIIARERLEARYGSIDDDSLRQSINRTMKKNFDLD